MILQTIQLPFDAGTADTIYTKQGETGRGIWFDLPFLIGEEEIPDYKAEFIAVKADDTFVIEDATITNHGDGDDLHSVCYITLPEQVSAAKGTGSYILKVYDYVHDNDLIYSAAGGLYVDDHLLLDSMIESIAEVNGYNFPDDFLTSADLAELIDDTATALDKTWSSQKISDELSNLEDEVADVIEDLIDDNDTSEDSTWSSQKIEDELGNIDVTPTYSTSETEAGTWIDGSTLYQRVLSIDNPTKQSYGSYFYYAVSDSIGSAVGYAGISDFMVYDASDGRWYAVPEERLISSENIYKDAYVSSAGAIGLTVFFSQSAQYNITKIRVRVSYTKA